MFEPGGQKVQSPLLAAPVVSRNRPALQFVGYIVLNIQYCPLGHSKQSESCVAPTTSRYVPGGQLAGIVVAMMQYSPAGHCRQFCTLCP